MYEETEEEYQQFLYDMKESGFIFGRYMDESDYEDEYSYNDIDEAKDILINKITDYLKQNRPSEFIVTGGWCVFVMTPNKARESRVSENTIENRLVR
jgi:hypothetical protein